MPDWAGYLRFRDVFGKVLDPRLYTLEWLDLQILSGAYRIWIGRNAAIVAELRRYPTGARELHGVIAAGDLDEIVEGLIPEAERWGRGLGCIASVIESREGWARALKHKGYRTHQVAVRKEF